MSTSSQAPLFYKSQLPAGGGLLLPGQNQLHRFPHEKALRGQVSNQAIDGALDEGCGVRRNCGAFGVTQHMVEPSRQHSLDLVATHKERAGRKPARLVRITLEWLEREPAKDEVNPGMIPVAAGILVDKRLIRRAQSIATVSVRRELDQKKMPALFASLQAQALEAELVSIDSESGERPPNRQQKRPVAPDVVARVVTSGPSVPDTTQSAHTMSPNFDLVPQTTITMTTATASSPESGGEGVEVDQAVLETRLVRPRKI